MITFTCYSCNKDSSFDPDCTIDVFNNLPVTYCPTCIHCNACCSVVVNRSDLDNFKLKEVFYD